MAGYADASARARALEILEKLEASGQIRPDEKSELDTLRNSADADNREIGATRATYRGATQGASFGFADEIMGAGAAAISPLTGGPGYAETRDAAREKNAEAETNFPEEFNTGRRAGQIGSAIVPFAGGARGLQGASLGANMLGGSIIGGVLGAADGFGSGEGGFGNRVANISGLDVGVGAGTGAVAPIMGKAAGRLLADSVSPPAPRTRGMGFDPKASKVAVRALSDDASVQDDVAGYLRNLGPEAMVADAGRNTQMLAGSVVATPGEGATRLVRAVDDRAKGSSARVKADLDAVGGGATNQYAAADARRAARSQEAGPLYEAAKAHPDPLDTREIVAAIDAAIDKSAPSSSILRRYRKKLVQGEEGAEVFEIDAETLHNLRSDLSDNARAIGQGGKPKGAKTLNDTLALLDAQLDTVPGYAKARQTWADSKALDDASDAGRKAFTSPDADRVAAETRLMSQPEKDAFASAARKDLELRIDRGAAPGTGARIVRPLEVQKTADQVFGKGAGERLARREEAEAVFADTRSRVGYGSDTAARQSAQGEIQPLIDADGLRVGPLRRARIPVENSVNKVIDALTGRPGGKSLDDLSQILVANDAKRDQIVRALLADGMQAAKNKKIQDRTQSVVQSILQAGAQGL